MPLRPALTILLAALALGSTTCLYSGAGPHDPGAAGLDPGWNPAIECLVRALTLPLTTADITDVRDVAPFVFLAALLLVAAFIKPAGNASPPRIFALHTRPARWLIGTTAVVVATGLLAALVRDRMDLAWGWLARFLAGIAWALVLGNLLSPRHVRNVLYTMLAVGLAAMCLAIAHRADHGLMHFTWPIGPITITAALAATWAALAAGWGVGTLAARRRTAHGWTLFILVTLTISLYVLIETGRRAPLLGLFAGLALTAAAVAWFRWPRRPARAGIAVAALVCVIAAGWYVARQAAHPERIVSGPLAVRFAYWREALDITADKPLIGIAPDSAVVPMTNRLDARRTLSPHVFAGNIDSALHNEWLQAAVELGIIGGLAYVALPIGIIALLVLQLRRALNDPPATDAPSPIPALCALMAALTAIGITESASITLRGPIMPWWYWTAVGLAVASTRNDECQQSTGASPADRAGTSLAPLLAAVIAILCIGLTASELIVSRAEALARPDDDGKFGNRLYSQKTIAAHYKAAALATRHAAAAPDARPQAAALWQDLYALLPGYRDTAAALAEARYAAGQTADADALLADTLDRAPYDPAATRLALARTPEPTDAQLLRAARILRSDAIDDALRAQLEPLLTDTHARTLVDARAADARTLPPIETGDAPDDDRAEWLRLSTLFAEQRDELARAIADQQAAAAHYERLERLNHPNRRAAPAETDVFLQLARLRYAAAPDNFDAAFDAVQKAERYAVLGIRHAYFADPRPELGFVGGVVMPTELPDRLQPLWQLSALLHIAAGRDALVDLRILSALPRAARTADALRQVRSHLYRRVCNDMRQLPADARPAHADHICATADQLDQ